MRPDGLAWLAIAKSFVMPAVKSAGLKPLRRFQALISPAICAASACKRR
jgi:hypothetical protein